jgi:hypothetical protein
MKLEQVKKDIEHWIVNFVEIANPALGGWPPCPYAKKARLEQDFDVRIGTTPIADLQALCINGLPKSVVILAYDPKLISRETFSNDLEFSNISFLLEKDLIVLEDHPDDAEIVNGVCMNQGTYALALVQQLSDLNEKARLMGRRGFYNTWPEDYLQQLFQHRTDPRLEK